MSAALTHRGFTLSDKVSAASVAGGQQLSLCILTAKFAKIPAAVEQRHKKGSKTHQHPSTFDLSCTEDENCLVLEKMVAVICYFFYPRLMT